MVWPVKALLIRVLTVSNNRTQSEGEVAHVVCRHLHRDVHGGSSWVFSHYYAIGIPLNTHLCMHIHVSDYIIKPSVWSLVLLHRSVIPISADSTLASINHPMHTKPTTKPLIVLVISRVRVTHPPHGRPGGRLQQTSMAGYIGLGEVRFMKSS